MSPEDYYVLDLILERGLLSDTSATMNDLKRMKVQEFSQVLPILDRLVQHDLVRRLPTDKSTEYQVNPIFLPPSKEATQEKLSEEE